MTVLDQVSLFLCFLLVVFLSFFKKRVQTVLLNVILQRDGAYPWCSGSHNHLIAIRFYVSDLSVLPSTVQKQEY